MTEAIPADERATCIACRQKYDEGDAILLLPCGHSLHDKHHCVTRLLPPKCYVQTCPGRTGEKLQLGRLPSSHYSSTSSPPAHKEKPPLPVEGNPSIMRADGRNNRILEAAKVAGVAFNLGNDMEEFPNFEAPRMGISPVAPRSQIPGPISHRRALIRPVASALAEMTGKGFKYHPLMSSASTNEETGVPQVDVELYANLSPIDKHKCWGNFIAQRNWWEVPASKKISRKYARDIEDCDWIEHTSAAIRTGQYIGASYLASHQLLSRHFHRFKSTLSYMYEGLYRVSKHRWISHHDVAWEHLSAPTLETNFPSISKAVRDLELPIGLAIPTPPTPFYYGAMMAKLQREDPECPLLQKLETSTLQEILILTMARFYAEMTFGGRLFRITRHAISQMQELLKDFNVNLPLDKDILFGVMLSVHDYPETLFCKVDYKLPDWYQVVLAKTSFVWCLKPGAELNKNALHGRRKTQKLDGTTKKDHLAAMRPLSPDHAQNMCGVLKKEEINLNPRLAAFVEQEYRGTIPLLRLGEVLERLSYRACEKLEKEGKVAPLTTRTPA